MEYGLDTDDYACTSGKTVGRFTAKPPFLPMDKSRGFTEVLVGSLATPDDPRFPWLSPRLMHPVTGEPITHSWLYLYYPDDPWPPCTGGQCPLLGLWVVVYDPWTQRHTVRCLRAVAGTSAASQPYLCRTHAHAALQQRAARRIPPRREQPPPRVHHATQADRLAWLAREAADDEAREAAQVAWDAHLRHLAHAVAAAGAAAPDWHRPHWFRPLRLPYFPQLNEQEVSR